MKKGDALRSISQLGLWDLRIPASRERMRDQVLAVLGDTPKSVMAISKLTGLDEVNVRQVLFDLGGDSLVAYIAFNGFVRVQHQNVDCSMCEGV